ncbi:TlpA disulfide reductase family protein [Streptomyces sp. NPDC001880]
MNFSRARQTTLLIFAGVLLLCACGNGESQTKYVDSGDGISAIPQDNRRMARGLKGKTIDGEQVNIADLKGKVVVINVWGSWCGPCRAEVPNFVKVAKETKKKGVEFIGINTRDANRSLVVAFEKEYKVEYPSLYDPTGKMVMNGFPKGTLNPQTVPSTIVLDRKGRIAARTLRALSEEGLNGMIDPVVKEN